MTTTYRNSIYQIRTWFKTEYDACIADPRPILLFQGDQTGPVPQPTDYFCRLSSREVDSGQSTLRGGPGVQEGRRFTTDAIVFVQVFAPKKGDPQAFDRGAEIAGIIKEKIFAGVTLPGSGIRFWRVYINEIPEDKSEAWFQWNVVAVYDYDTVR